MTLSKNDEYRVLLDSVGQLLDNARKKAFTSLNTLLVETYWEIGRRIVLFEQKGQERAQYGEYLLELLAKDLRLRYGKGFSRSNVTYMRLFFLKYQKCETLSHLKIGEWWNGFNGENVAGKAVGY